jgi:hypothetical protein
MVEELLKFFVGEVDTELLEAVVLSVTSSISRGKPARSRFVCNTYVCVQSSILT